jgi:AcrR family transcriptional regulator
MTGIVIWSFSRSDMKNSTRQKTTKDAILDATDTLLARNGYKKMTIDDLAREVGIGKGSVYLHFQSKKEIALSHIDRIIERLKVRLRAIAETETGHDVRIRRMIIERIVFRFESVQHYSQSLNDLLAQLRTPLLDRRNRYFAEEAKIFEKVLSSGEKAGAFSIKDPSESAKAIIEATNALLPYSLSVVELGERKEIEKKADRVAELILDGLIKR